MELRGSVLNFGLDIKDLILNFASILVTDEAPGWVAALFVFGLLGLVGWVSYQTHLRLRAIEALLQEIRLLQDGPALSDRFEALLGQVRAWSIKNKAQKRLGVAFDEYAQTTILDPKSNLRRHAVRPSMFLNLEDLGFGHGWLRIVPGTFVSIGLLCTFLGLVAALNSLGTNLQEGEKPEIVVEGLMKIASAKFIMSLVGLFCSIIFSIILRLFEGQVSDRLHVLCSTLEARLSYVSLEDIGFRQLGALQEQRDFYKHMATELVAELSRPLADMPDKISKSISSALEPMLTGRQVLESIDKTSENIAKAGDKVTEALEQKVLGNIDTLSARFAGIVDQINDSLVGLDRFSSGIKAGAEGIAAASSRFEGASNDLVRAAEPIRGTQQSIEAAIRDLLAASNATAEGSKTIARDAAQVLETARTALGQERTGIHQTMLATEAILQRLSQEAEQLDKIDQMLGRALRDYADQLDKALGSARTYIADMTQEITGSVDAMRQVVEQAEKFIPSSPRVS